MHSGVKVPPRGDDRTIVDEIWSVSNLGVVVVELAEYRPNVRNVRFLIREVLGIAKFAVGKVELILRSSIQQVKRLKQEMAIGEMLPCQVKNRL